MSLVRILPDVQLGRPQGVVTLLDTVDAELRQLAADEMSRDLAKEDDSSIVAKGKGKDKGGKGKDKGPKGKGKDKDGGKSSAKQGQGGTSSQDSGAADQRKTKPCMWFWTENGCYRKSCPFSHDENTSLSLRLQQHPTPQHWLEPMMRKETRAKPRLNQRLRPRRPQ